MHWYLRQRLRVSTWAGMLVVTLLLLAAAPGRSVQQPTVDESAKSAAKPLLEVYRLKNDDLLMQASGIYDKAAQEYRSALRAVAAAELLLGESA